MNWWRIVQRGPDVPPDFSESDREYVRDAFDLLPPEPWNKETWKTWTDQVKDKTHRKGSCSTRRYGWRSPDWIRALIWLDLLPLLVGQEYQARRPRSSFSRRSPTALLVLGATAMRLSDLASSSPS